MKLLPLYSLLFLSLFCSRLAYGQVNKLEKRIYLFDVTASMEGRGQGGTENIFADVKHSLLNAIEAVQSPKTEIVLLTFTNKVHEKKSFFINELDSIRKYIDQIQVQKGDTNIADAWEAGVEEVNPDKLNYVFLLTDGIHNTGPDKQILYDRLKGWGDYAMNHYYYGFYVMLTKTSEDVELEKVIKETNQLYIIKSPHVNITFLTTSSGWKANIKNNKRIKIQYQKNTFTPFPYQLNIKATLSDNPYYKIKRVDNHLSQDLSLILEIEELVPLKQIPIEVDLTFTLDYEREKYPMLFIVPEKVNVKIQNRGIRSVTIKEKR
ncbi:vWA domain-containing protein [Myroides sp. WP-1]|uniref:VWA domain-containing protein n=1 Tax=Myroides sp. WP-1 TaxID=2759944 RepID=UPI0015FC448E|nr:vWA domain-containing protein [Myroides sp. WP-1]MBB1137961.1 VWA domain-containing protein [Myroides sp. WP-1]